MGRPQGRKEIGVPLRLVLPLARRVLRHVGKLLAALFVALLMVGCGGDDSGENNPESNQSSVETPPVEPFQVVKIDLDENETLDKPSKSEPKGEPFTVPGLSMGMLCRPPGAFEMGSPESEKKRSSSETQHAEEIRALPIGF